MNLKEKMYKSQRKGSEENSMKKGFRNRVCSISMAVAMAMLTACGAAEKPAEGLVSSGTETGTTESGQADTGITESGQADTGATESSQEKTGVTESAPENTDATEAQPEYATKLHITINPDMALYLDEADSVVLVEYLNEDAEKAYAGTDMTGININEAMDVIVDTAVAGGYLTEGKTISVDVVECAEEKAVEELTAQLQTSLQEAAAKKELAITLELKVDGELKTEIQTETAKEPCPACGGTGICAECGGGTLPCKRCKGTLVETCGNCDASGMQKCPGCKGSGVDATSGEACRHCGGAGKITCELCGGTHGKPCTICNGKGVVSDDCILCHGGKKCTVCGGTGVAE